MFRRSLLLAALALGLSAPPALAQSDSPVIAAAANLEGAIAQISAAFTAATGQEVRVSLGSTGNLARQIRQGAPFALFLSADEATPLMLASEGLTQGEGTVFAFGRLALVVPTGGALAADDGTLEGLRAALAAGQITRFAIANPEHAPFGVAARQALQHAGLWEAIQPHLILGENVAQAAHFALSGNADGGLVALSLALAPAAQEQGTHAAIPEDFHAPLAQRMVLLGASPDPVAVAFHDFLLGPEARDIFLSLGYGLPRN